MPDERWPALELASTIRHDGDGGVADDLATLHGTADWVRARTDLLAGPPPAAGITVDEALHAELVELRRAVRALFARAVTPAPPSPADAHRLMPAAEALERLNAFAAREPVAPQLVWPEDGPQDGPEGHPPAAALLTAEEDPAVRLLAALARAAIDFLGGPAREQLRACTAPRCVRYFVKSHGRQEWCKPSCGNRARAARHYRRHHAAQESAPS